VRTRWSTWVDIHNTPAGARKTRVQVTPTDYCGSLLLFLTRWTPASPITWHALIRIVRERICAEFRKVGQSPIAFLVVQTVPYDEFVRTEHPAVVDRYLDRAAVRLIEQHAGAKLTGAAAAQQVLEVVEREAVVDDVLDDDHVAIFQALGGVFQ
jgi:hypothetical protein